MRRLVGIALASSVVLALLLAAPRSSLVTAQGVLGTPAAQAPADPSALLQIKFYEIASGRLAFTFSREKQRDIYVLDFGALTVEPLVRTPGIDDFPAWSPDGQKLAYSSDASGDSEIYTVNADGKGTTQLTKVKGIDEEPSWSPDGSRIVFSSSRDGNGRNIYLMNADGSKPELLPIAKKKSSAILSQPRWSPRDSELLYATNEDWPGWDLGVFNFKDRSTKLLTVGYQSFQRASWEPDGGAFVMSYGSAEEIDLLEFRKGAKELKPLVAKDGKQFDAIWLPDGSRLFFVSEKEPGKGEYQIYTWDRQKNKVELVLETNGSVRNLSWTPFPTLAQLEQNFRKQSETK